MLKFQKNKQGTQKEPKPHLDNNQMDCCNSALAVFFCYLLVDCFFHVPKVFLMHPCAKLGSAGLRTCSQEQAGRRRADSLREQTRF